MENLKLTTDKVDEHELEDEHMENLKLTTDKVDEHELEDEHMENLKLTTNKLSVSNFPYVYPPVK